MKRKQIAVLLFFLLAGSTFALLLFWQKTLVPVKNEDHLEDIDAIYFLEQPEKRKNGQEHESIQLHVPASLIQNDTLAIFRSRNFSLYAPETDTPLVLLPSISYRRLQTLQLTEELYDRSTGILSLEWSADEYFLSQRLYLIPTNRLNQMYEFYSMIQYILVGIFFLMLVYGLYLYSCKTEEHYLLYFSIFISSLLGMMVINIAPLNISIPNRVYMVGQPALTMLQLCLGLLACFDFIDYPQPPFYRILLSWPGILVTCSIYAVITACCSVYIAGILRFTYFILFTIMLLTACSQNYRGAFTLLAGHSIKMGIVLMQTCVNMGLLHDWIAFIFLRAALIPELPFAFACMFCITRRFADKFKESEELTAKLSSLNQDLDRQVEQRTRQYQEQMEQRHNMMLNVFHDLRTPLFTLKGCVDLLTDEFPQEKDLLEVMKQRLSFAANMTEDLFLLAKLEDNEWMIPFGPLCLKDVLSPICNSLKVEAEKKHLNMQISGIPAVPLWGNCEQLQRAFQNFITNAIHYTPANGSVSIDCRTESDHVLIRISDTGKGMNQEDLSHLFTRYYQSTSHGSTNSTGLGLSIAKSIIDRHRGSIHVESSPGCGTSISIELPLAP